MESIVDAIKRQNNANAPRSKRRVWLVVLVLFVGGLAFVVSGNDALLTPGVLSIFASMVLSIVGLFLFALQASNLRAQRISNTVEIGYRALLDQHNLDQGTDYDIRTDPSLDEDWILLPSYADRSVFYEITEGTLRLYHGQSFIKAGAEQRKTYFLRGLYLILDGPKGALQYRSRTNLGGTLIDAFKGLYGTDRFDVSRYSEQRAYEGGTLFHGDMDIPTGLPDWIALLQEVPYVRSFRLGLHESRMHVALELDAERLPHVTRGTEEEWTNIEQTVSEHLRLLDKWKSLIHTTKD
jgi:hypothetical protein